MPVYIENMTSEVAILEGEIPLSEEQIEKLIKLVLMRLEEKQRENKQVRDAIDLRRESMPKMHIG